ncbi:MAG TPA: hypothetical protein VGN88_06850, partial [Phycisphaerae bacterium]
HATLGTLLEAVTAENHCLAYTAPRLTTPNAYRVNFLQDLSHPDGPRPATAASAPLLLAAPASTYLAFSIAPIISGDRRSIACEFSALQISRVPPPPSAASTRPADINDAKGIIVSIPDGGTILVGKAIISDQPQPSPSTYLLLFIRTTIPRGSEGYNPTFHAAGGINDQLNLFVPPTVNDLLWALHDPAATPPVAHSRPTGLPPPTSQPQR